MQFKRTDYSLLLLLFASIAVCSTQAAYIGSSDVAAGSHAAGLLGSYAGALTAGQTLSALGKADAGVHEAELEAHEFSIGQAGDELGSLGDHLSEHSFPADYGSGHTDGLEYAEAEAEAEAAAAASEQHDQYEPLQLLEDHEVQLHEEFDEKPVPGIDHGKGAFSYSTLYEFKDHEAQPHELL